MLLAGLGQVEDVLQVFVRKLQGSGLHQVLEQQQSAPRRQQQSLQHVDDVFKSLASVSSELLVRPGALYNQLARLPPTRSPPPLTLLTSSLRPPLLIGLIFAAVV